MATLTSAQLVELMRHVNKNVAEQTWTKAQISAALQAIEDRMLLASTKTTISSDIEAAAPGVFDNNQKNILFAVWCITFATRQGVL